MSQPSIALLDHISKSGSNPSSIGDTDTDFDPDFGAKQLSGEAKKA